MSTTFIEEEKRRVVREVPLVRLAISFNGTVYSLQGGAPGSRQFILAHSGGAPAYTVTVADHHDGTRDTCTCQDHLKRNSVCKHIRAIRDALLARIFQILTPLDQE